MLPVLASALQAAVVTQAAPLPPTFDLVALRGCAPRDLTSAEACLRQAVAEPARTMLLDQGRSRMFRPALDAELRADWRLDDSEQPLARDIEHRLGFYQPAVAIGFLLADMQNRPAGAPLDPAILVPVLKKMNVPVDATNFEWPITQPVGAALSGGTAIDIATCMAGLKSPPRGQVVSCTRMPDGDVVVDTAIAEPVDDPAQSASPSPTPPQETSNVH